jgi:DNA processing protein
MREVQTILRLENSFPERLRDLPTWPPELQVQGTLKQEGPGIAIVGARAATQEGMRAAHSLAAELAAAGCRILSGGALGIDAAAHRGALAAGGYTLAVMACGLDSYYPRRNAPLFESILGGGGAMVSPFPLGVPPLPSNFVRRNSIIAVLADLVVVVEASLASGSLHTARFALRYRRPLAAYGKSPGCESLLARGVAQVGDGSEVLDLLAGKARYMEPGPAPAAGSAEAQVLSRLSCVQAQSVSGLAQALGLPLRQTQRILHRLELESLAVLGPGQRYLRSRVAPPQDST